MNSLGCVTGRFQPVHAQHVELFELALEHCEHLLVAITNPDSSTRQADPSSHHRHTASANPFSYYERARLIEAALYERGLRGRCTLVPFDLHRQETWSQYVPFEAHQFVRAYSEWEREKARWLEQAGYGLSLIEGDPARKHSASQIRAALRSGSPDWRGLVPPATVPLLEQMLSRQPLEARA